MRIIAAFLAALVCTGFALVAGRAVQARTPTPTATQTATATAAPTATPQLTPCPPDTPTADPAEVAQFSGEMWLMVPGPYPPGALTARIGDTVCSIPAYIPPTCGRPPAITVPVDPGPATADYAIDVLPASVKPGCGYEGAEIKFYIGDKLANQTAVWHAGTSRQLDVNSGPPFALFKGKLTLAFKPSEPIGVGWPPLGMIALVNGNVCGEAVYGIWRMPDSQGRWVYPYMVQAYSAERQQGCGVDGDSVTLELIWNTTGTGNVSQGKVVGVARQKGIWHAWGDGNVGQNLDLTMDPPGAIQLASLGDGSSQRSGSPVWIELAVGLGLAGAFGVATSVAVRKRVARR